MYPNMQFTALSPTFYTFEMDDVCRIELVILQQSLPTPMVCVRNLCSLWLAWTLYMKEKLLK
jgi:hypothetical protein